MREYKLESVMSMERNNDLLKIGDVFGELTICECLGRIHSPKDNHYFYKVKCSCGNETIIAGTYLKTGKRSACKICNVAKSNNQKTDFLEIGKRYGKVIIIENLGKIKPDVSNHRYYKIKCDCGREEIIRDSLLRTGKKTECYNCSIKKRPQYKHGKTNTRLFKIWQGMKQRCNCETCDAFKWYGGRGITICEEWKDFENFYQWAMNNGYKAELSLDRIDVNGNYEPINCRWATDKQQMNNMRTNRLITYNGETHTLSQWAEKIGVEDYILDNRLNKYNWTIEKTLTTPKCFTKKKK